MTDFIAIEVCSINGYIRNTVQQEPIYAQPKVCKNGYINKTYTACVFSQAIQCIAIVGWFREWV